MSGATPESVLEALKTVEDPELHKGYRDAWDGEGPCGGQRQGVPDRRVDDPGVSSEGQDKRVTWSRPLAPLGVSEIALEFGAQCARQQDGRGGPRICCRASRTSCWWRPARGAWASPRSRPTSRWRSRCTELRWGCSTPISTVPRCRFSWASARSPARCRWATASSSRRPWPTGFP